MQQDMTYLCPSCGHEAKVGEHCPGCPKPKARKPKKQKAKPAPRQHAWKQDSYYDGMDLPDEDFDYDEFIAKEFGTPHQKLQVKWYWWVLGIVLIFLLASGAYHICLG